MLQQPSPSTADLRIEESCLPKPCWGSTNAISSSSEFHSSPFFYWKTQQSLFNFCCSSEKPRVALSSNSLNTCFTVLWLSWCLSKQRLWWLEWMFKDVLVNASHCLCQLCIFLLHSSCCFTMENEEMKDKKSWENYNEKKDGINYSENLDPMNGNVCRHQ